MVYENEKPEEVIQRNYNLHMEQDKEMINKMGKEELLVNQELFYRLIGKPFYERPADNVLIKKLSFVQKSLQQALSNDTYFDDLKKLSYEEIIENKKHCEWIINEANKRFYNSEMRSSKEKILKIDSFIQYMQREKKEFPPDTRKKISLTKFKMELRNALFDQDYNGVWVLKSGGM